MALAEKASFVRIGKKVVGPGHPCFIIAEAGVNHNGDLGLARSLVDAAAQAGADAVKFQTWVTDRICRPGTAKAAYQQRDGSSQEDQYAMLKRLELPFAWHPELKERAESHGLVFLSTPDDIASAEFLCALGVDAIKVGSAELKNVPHLVQLARLGKPLILSTGMSTLEDVSRAFEAVQEGSRLPAVLLHCVSAYPAPDSEMNLSAIPILHRTFGVPVGLSDHTEGHTAAVIGVALGMNMLEKHLTLDRSMAGPDHAASADVAEFAELVRMVRKAETMLGTGVKAVTPSERDTLAVVTRTLVYSSSLAAGKIVSDESFESLRCGEHGLPPEAAAGFVGKSLRRDVLRGSVVDPADFRED